MMNTDISQTIFNNPMLGIVLFQSEQPNVADCNEAFARFLGYERSELIGKTIADFSHHEDWTAEKRDISAVFQGEIDHYQTEKRFVHKDGHLLWGHSMTVANRGADGNVQSIIKFVQDITAQRKSLQAVEQQEFFLRNVIDAVPNLITVKNRDGQYTLVNLAAAEFYGMTVGDMEGLTDVELGANAGDPNAIRQQDLEVLKTLQEKFILDQTARDATGRTHVWQVYRRPIFVEAGDDYQVLTICTDVTEFKKISQTLEASEERLSREQAQLEERVQRQTRELESQSERLSQLMQLYFRSFDAMKRFMGRRIEGVRCAEQRPQCMTLEDQSLRGLFNSMTHMVDFTQIMMGESLLHIEKTNLQKICKDVTDTLTRQFQSKNIGFQWKNDFSVKTLEVDEKRLREALLILGEALGAVTPDGETMVFEVRGDAPAFEVRLSFEIALCVVTPDVFRSALQQIELDEKSIPEEISPHRLGLLLAHQTVRRQKGEWRIESNGEDGLRVQIILPWVG